MVTFLRSLELFRILYYTDKLLFLLHTTGLNKVKVISFFYKLFKNFCAFFIELLNRS